MKFNLLYYLCNINISKTNITYQLKKKYEKDFIINTAVVRRHRDELGTATLEDARGDGRRGRNPRRQGSGRL